MHPYLRHAGAALFHLAESKLLFKPAHEIAVVLFGTTDTSNALNVEMASEGDPGQYLHISVVHSLQCPTLGYLTTLKNLPKGTGASDFLDALVVGLDMLIKTGEARNMDKASKKIILLSNFTHPTKPLPPEFEESIVAQTRQLKAAVQFVVLQDLSAKDLVAANMSMLRNIADNVQGQITEVADAVDLMGLFRSKEVSSTTMYRGPLQIGSSLEIQVRVYKKTAMERPPSLKPYSDRSRVPGATHEVFRDTEYKAPSAPDEAVGPEDRVRAYRYGRQTVPVQREEEEVLSLRPERGLQVVGFVSAAAVPRHHFLKDCSVLLPDSGAGPGHWEAFAALHAALSARGQVAVVRCVMRARAAPYLGALSPHAGGAAAGSGGGPAVAPSTPAGTASAAAALPPCLVLNVLPFSDDVRQVYFPPWHARPELLPNQAQLQAAEALVKDLDLGPDQGHAASTGAGRGEVLVPETTVNPVLRRFYAFLGEKALDPDAQVPSDDPLVTRTFTAPLSPLPSAAESALTRMAEVFHTTAPATARGAAATATGPAQSGADGAAAAASGFARHQGVVFKLEGEEGAGRMVDGVGTAAPLEDFQALLSAGRVSEALRGLSAAVPALLSASIGEGLHGKALDCLAALRAAALQHRQPGDFNTLLQELAGPRRSAAGGEDFWRRVRAEGLRLISRAEVPESDISEDRAAEFERAHAQKQDTDTGPDVDLAADEFADME